MLTQKTQCVDALLTLEFCNVDDEGRIVKQRLQFRHWVCTNLCLGLVPLSITVWCPTYQRMFATHWGPERLATTVDRVYKYVLLAKMSAELIMT